MKCVICRQYECRGPVHLPKPFAKFLLFGFRKRRSRKEEVARQVISSLLCPDSVRTVKNLPDLGKLHAEVGTHVDILASLAWKQECQLPPTRHSLLAEINSPLFVNLSAL